MKYIEQLMVIILFSFIGELLNYVIPLPIPASIYGMILLFTALSTKIIKLEQVEETGEYLMSIMLIFFVPAAVGIMDTFFQYQSSMVKIIVIVVISTITVQAFTGLISQVIIRITNKKSEKEEIKLLKGESKKWMKY